MITTTTCFAVGSVSSFTSFCWCKLFPFQVRPARRLSTAQARDLFYYSKQAANPPLDLKLNIDLRPVSETFGISNCGIDNTSLNLNMLTY